MVSGPPEPTLRRGDRNSSLDGPMHFLSFFASEAFNRHIPIDQEHTQGNPALFVICRCHSGASSALFVDFFQRKQRGSLRGLRSHFDSLIKAS